MVEADDVGIAEEQQGRAALVAHGDLVDVAVVVRVLAHAGLDRGRGLQVRVVAAAVAAGKDVDRALAVATAGPSGPEKAQALRIGASGFTRFQSELQQNVLTKSGDAAELRGRAVYTTLKSYEQARESGKPEAIIDKMVEGRLRKFYEEAVLLKQVFVVDGERTVEEGRDAVRELDPGQLERVARLARSSPSP